MYKYGVIKANPKKLTIISSRIGAYAHLTINNGTQYDVSIYLGSDRDPIRYSLFTSTDRVAMAYLLPTFEARFRLEWFDSFNRLQNSETNGALDFMRNRLLYEHIIQPYNLSSSVPSPHPFNERIEDNLVVDNATLTRKYGCAATALRALFYLYPNRNVIVFGNLLDGTGDRRMIDTTFNQYIDRTGVLSNPYADGAVFFWDPLTNRIDGIFIMKESSYQDFIINLPAE